MNFIVSQEAPTIELLSQTPTVIFQNSTGYLNISYGITHDSLGLNNTSVSFIYRNYDQDLSDSNHSIRVPENNISAVWNYNGQILRAANRNETLNFENNDTITGGDIYTWSGLDENNTRLTIVPVNSTYTLVYINGTIHDLMPQMWYVDRTDLQEAPKTQLAIHKNQNVLIKFWSFEIYKGNYDYLGVGYTDTALDTNSALHPEDATPLQFYYVNSSYNPAIDGDPLTSGYAIYMGSANASTWTDHVYSPHANSSYVRGFINNSLIHSYITTTEISYLYFTSDTPSAKPFYINVTDVSTSTNVSFADTNVLWTGDTAPYTPQSYTPNIWFSFMKPNITFDHKLYVADNNGLWENSTLNRTNITGGLFPPTKPTFYSFHNGFIDNDMNGTYSGTFDVQIGASSDPDGGVVTHNLTLHYGANNTYLATINNTFTSANGVFANITFDSTSYYSTEYNYTMRVVATDDENEIETTWLSVNFTLYITPDPTTLQNTTYNHGINFTWAAGSGVVTDSYNVSLNTTWYNGSSQAWANNSTVPHGTIDIIVYAYNDSSGLSTGNVTDSVTVPNNVPVFSGIPDENTNEDTDLIDIFDLDDYASDADGDPLSFAVQSNNQSANVTVNINAGNTVSFLLASNWYGVAAVTFNVSDGNGGTDTDSMLLTVNSVNDPPVMDPIGPITENENETVIIDVDATDPDGDTLTYACNRTDLFTDFDTGNGMGTWGTNYSSAGIYYVNFSVSDGNSGEDYEVVTITIIDIPLSISSYWNNVTGSSLTVSVEPGDTVLFGVTTNRTATNISWYNGSTFLENDTATSQGNLTHQFNSKGTFDINVSAMDAYDTTSNTTFTVSVGYAVPAVVSYSPNTPHRTYKDINVTFDVTFTQTGNITWYLNGVQIQTNNTTTSASYVNTTGVIGGPYNVTAAFMNDNGSVSQTWAWTVREDAIPLLFNIFILLILMALILSGYSVMMNDTMNYTHIVSGFLAAILWFICGWQSYIGIGFEHVIRTPTYVDETLVSTIDAVEVTSYQYGWLGMLFILIAVIMTLYSVLQAVNANKDLIEELEDKDEMENEGY